MGKAYLTNHFKRVHDSEPCAEFLQAPTGSGKSYEMLQFMEKYAGSDEIPKIICISSQHKNMEQVYTDLKQYLKRTGRQANVLYIKSNFDNLIELFCNEKALEQIPKDIKDDKCFHELEDCVKQFLTYDGNGKVVRNDVKVVDAYRSAISSAFSRFKSFVAKYYGLTGKMSREQRKINLKKFEEAEENEWARILWPYINFKNANVVFMTASRFGSPFSSPGRSMDNAFATWQNCFIFIDESDSVHAGLLDTCLRQLKEADFLAFPRKAAAGLRGRFKQDLMIQKYKDLNALREEVLKEAEELVEEYHLESNSKWEEKSAETFLFQYVLSGAIGRTREYVLEYDDQEKTNRIIHLSKSELQEMLEGKHKEWQPLETYLQKVNGLIGRVTNLVTQCTDKRWGKDPADEESPWYNIYKSTVHELDLDDKQREYLDALRLASPASHESRQRIKRKIEELTKGDYYYKGMQYFIVENGDDHMYDAILFGKNIPNLPEKQLLYLSINNWVICLSATAKLNSVFCNFNISWLKQYANIYQETSADLEEIEAWKSRKKYKKDLLKLECVGALPEDTTDYFSDSKTLRDLDEDLQKALTKLAHKYFPLTSNSDGHYLRQAEKIMYVIARAIEANEPLLVTMTAYLGEGRISPSAIKETIKCCNNFYKAKFKLEELKNEDDKKRIISDLSHGQQLIIFTSYKSFVIGQNLQYEVDDVSNYVPITKDGKKKNKNGRYDVDISRIYCEKPTNVITPENDTINLLKTEYQIQGLYEKCQINRHELKDYSNAIASGNIATVKNKLKADNIDYIAAEGRDIVQAIGRMCRTSLMKKEVHVYLDDKIWLGDGDQYDGLQKLVAEKLLPYGNTISQQDKKLRLANETCFNRINKLKYRKKSGEFVHMNIWEPIRLFALKYPCASEEDLSEDNIKKEFEGKVDKNAMHGLLRYIPDLYYERGEIQKSPVLKYALDDDIDGYNDIQYVHLAGKGDLGNVGIVSERSARLDLALTIPTVNKWFLENGYATEFTRSKYILTPVAFNNFYKGALGEKVVGLCLSKLAEECGHKIVGIDDPKNYEKMDFQLEGTKIFIDAKNWSEENKKDADSIIDRKIRIAEDLKPTALIFIEAVNQGKEKYIISDEIREGIRVIQIPALYFSTGGLAQENSKAFELLREVFKKG